MKQYILSLNNHESTRKVILLSNQIILQAYKHGCGCSKCGDEVKNTKKILKANNISFHYESIANIIFLRICPPGVNSKTELTSFLTTILMFDIENVSDEKDLLAVKENVPTYEELCGYLAFEKFTHSILDSAYQTAKGKVQFSVIYKAALKGKIYPKEKLDELFKRAKAIRRKMLRNRNESFQKSAIVFREELMEELRKIAA